jgi:CheY-specific phosphatase CheX
MKAQIIAEKQQIAAIVRQMTEEVFNTMFSNPLMADDKSRFSEFKDVVISQVKLNHGPTDINFYFKFDMQLLLQIGMKMFSEEYLRDNPIYEDLACEVANIVCAKVKAYLNEEGYHTEMSFPFIPKGADEGAHKDADFVNVYFFYLDKEARQQIGVAVGSTVV